ncbi:hypothetical protein ACHAWF_018737 [Thalassiosira exigua]
MGIPCAPAWATLFQGLDEQDVIIPTYTIQLLIFIQYIGDMFGTWLRIPMGHSFDDLERSMNKGCLEWEFTSLSKSVVFLDLTLSIDDEGGLGTTLFEKKWLSTSSSRQIWPTPRVSLQGTSLAKSSASIASALRRRSALANARKFMTTNEAARAATKEKKKEEAARRVYFRREYHPQGPPSRNIQQLSEEAVLQPPGKETLNSLEGGISRWTPW